MRVYVTTVGTSPEAVFNPIWYLAEVYSWVPDRVYLFWNEKILEKVEKLVNLIASLGNAYGKEIEVIRDESVKFNEENPIEFREKVSNLLKSLVPEHEVVVDITPGRKFMSALMLGAGIASNAHEIVYLHLNNFPKYIGKLLFDIPMSEQALFQKKHLTGIEGRINFAGRRREEPVEVRITREEVMRVLNSLYVDEERNFPIKIKNSVLGTVKLDREVEFRVSTFIDIDEELHGGYNMVKEALISGGLAKFRNWDELIRVIRAHKGSRRPVYVGFDTNALYFRVPSRLLSDERLKEKGNLIVDFVYSEEVQREVGAKLNSKLPYDSKYGDYANQPTPQARLGWLGSVELENLRKVGAEPAKSRETVRGDTKIALDYKVFAEEKDADVIVITLDDGAFGEMQALAGSGLIPFKLDWEFSFGSTLKGSWEELRDSVYTLAVLLGELSLGKYKLKGIWRGKSSRDWIEERLIVKNFDYPRILKIKG
ncbi:hypothetical protein [Pyrococcus horikoshii]|nr:hypothetical protein [Pyrococcus horikoshii]HII61480.1 hypothetical protein [Pyrococcus horikoshii]